MRIQNNIALDGKNFCELTEELRLHVALQADAYLLAQDCTAKLAAKPKRVVTRAVSDERWNVTSNSCR